MSDEHTGIYAFETALSSRLMTWAATSVAAGGPLALVRNPFWRGFAGQSVAWGLIDAAIALAGRRGAEAKAALPENQTPAQQAEERESLRRVLLINAGLDVTYVLGGLALATTRGRQNPYLRGTGWGIATQGAFLLVFDVLHARRLSRTD